jgi:transposase
MLDESVRATILKLHERGASLRQIARTLRVSRGAARGVLSSGTTRPPTIERTERAAPFQDEILELHAQCRGNLVRVHEELVARGLELSYQALTAFCRRHGIGHERPLPAGEYHFEPGQEMQHDTSPHKAAIGGKTTRVETAALVLCYSRMLFFQHYPAFNRFYCKVFLSEAARYMGGACRVCLIDNTHVVVAAGTGAGMVSAPEMEAFAERLGFVFRAHAVGDANRKGRVERSFHFIEHNFLAGRRFADWSDLNQKARVFCDDSNARHRRHLHASPRELFAREQMSLVPLPLHLPEVYLLHHRIVDVEGYVTVQRQRYSVPYTLIGRRVEARETQKTVEVYDGPRRVAEHARVLDTVARKITLPEHRPPRGAREIRPAISAEEQAVRAADPALAAYVDALKKRLPGMSATLALRRLCAFLREYPEKAVLTAVSQAAHYGLFNMQRLETMILRTIHEHYFLVPEDHDAEEK